MDDSKYIIDPADLDLNTVIADIEDIRGLNPQRFEMEQITAIILLDKERNVFAGYKDVRDDEFWVRGHMPGMPLMPGVMMLEAVAQMSSYFVQKYDLLQSEMVGFGGLEDVRFRGIVRPGDRLVLVGQLLKARPKRMIISRFQGFVGQTMVVDGTLKGIPLPLEALKG